LKPKPQQVIQSIKRLRL